MSDEKLRKALFVPVVVLSKINDLNYKIQYDKVSTKVVHYNKLFAYYSKQCPKWLKAVLKKMNVKH